MRFWGACASSDFFKGNSSFVAENPRHVETTLMRNQHYCKHSTFEFSLVLKPILSGQMDSSESEYEFHLNRGFGARQMFKPGGDSE